MRADRKQAGPQSMCVVARYVCAPPRLIRNVGVQRRAPRAALSLPHCAAHGRALNVPSFRGTFACAESASRRRARLLPTPCLPPLCVSALNAPPPPSPARSPSSTTRPRHAARGARYLPRCNARRMLTAIFVVILCGICFASSSDTWLMWVSLTFMIASLGLVDLLFLDDSMVCRASLRAPRARLSLSLSARVAPPLTTGLPPRAHTRTRARPLLRQFMYDPEYANWARKSAPSYETTM
jgi:hypothetical protein